MLEAFKDIVHDISAIGTHSLRSDGATAAANAGVPLVNQQRTCTSKILYLLVCRFLRL